MWTSGENLSVDLQNIDLSTIYLRYVAYMQEYIYEILHHNRFKVLLGDFFNQNTNVWKTLF